MPRAIFGAAGCASDSTRPCRRPHRGSNRSLGILILEAVFAFQDAAIKLLSDAFPVWEVMFARNCVSSALLLAFIVLTAGASAVKTQHLAGHLVRSSLVFVSSIFSYLAVAALPLATAAAITFLMPLFVMALSWPLLGERVGLHRWGAVVVGFGGVLIMLRPGGGLGGIFCAAFAYALVTIVTRRLSRHEESNRLAFYS